MRIGIIINWNVLTICLIAGAITYKFYLVAWFPFLLFMNAPHDSTLFLAQAISLLNGEWLGPYTNLTLMKGPMYSFWIALCALLGIPLMLAQEALYIFASASAAYVTSKVLQSRSYGILVFLVLLFNPYTMSYTVVAGAFRVSLYQALALLLLALLILIMYRWTCEKKARILESMALGLCFFCFWYTREEGLWIVPVIVFFLFTGLLVAVKSSLAGFSKSYIHEIILLLTIALPAVTVFFAARHVVAELNYRHYGVYTVVELKTPQFRHAMNNMLRINAQQWQRDRTMPSDVIDKLYKHTMFSKLKSFDWYDKAVRENKPRADVPNMMISWELRRAVEDAGYYHLGGQEVLDFYQELGDDIARYCDQHESDECTTVTFDMLPPMDKRYLTHFVFAFKDRLKKIKRYNGFDTVDDKLSDSADEYIYKIDDLVNNRIRINSESLKRFEADYYKRIKNSKITHIEFILNKVYIPLIKFILYFSLMMLPIAFTGWLRFDSSTIDATVFLGLVGSFTVMLLMFAILAMTGYVYTIRIFGPAYAVIFLTLPYALSCLKKCTTRLSKRLTQ